MKSYVVIGLGRFGMQMAAKLYDCGEDVLAIDTDAALIDKFADRVTKAVAADARALRTATARSWPWVPTWPPPP